MVPSLCHLGQLSQDQAERQQRNGGYRHYAHIVEYHMRAHILCPHETVTKAFLGKKGDQTSRAAAV